MCYSGTLKKKKIVMTSSFVRGGGWQILINGGWGVSRFPNFSDRGGSAASLFWLTSYVNSPIFQFSLFGISYRSISLNLTVFIIIFCWTLYNKPL